MKRNLLLIGSFLLAFAFLVNVSAEESFFEESFLSDSMPEESFFEGSFNGNEFFAEDFLVSEENSEDIGTEEIEDRSVLAIPGEELETLSYDWQVAPKNLLAEMPKANTVKLTWEHPLAKLPTGVKFYVYEQQKDGIGTQVGVVTAKTITLKNVPGGKHIYFIRAEFVDSKKERELHGADSEPSNEVNVTSELWKKAPVLTIEQTGASEVTLRWTPDNEADRYEIIVTHGKVKSSPVSSDDGTFTDYGAVIGKNTYEVYAVWSNHHTEGEKRGKAAKKTVTLLTESWKTAPIIRKAVQKDTMTAQVSFFHVSMAEKYEIAVGSQKTIVYPHVEDYDAETGCFIFEVPFKGTGKQKVTVQPLGTNEKNKMVKGTKSGNVTLVTLKDILLGATNVKAIANGRTVTVSWENWNKNANGECRVYLFNAEKKKVVKDTRSPYGTESSCSFVNMEDGKYKVFVRIFTEKDAKDSTITDEALYDTVNLLMPEVLVDGVTLENLFVTLSETNKTLYLETTPKFQLKANKNDIKRNVIWNSSNPIIASVDSNGIVTGKNAGKVTITATAGNNVASCQVTVNPVTYRALVVGQRYPHYDSDYSYDGGVRFKNDMLFMEKMLQGCGYEVETSLDASKSSLKRLVRTVFREADENDISLYFHSGHGYTDKDDEIWSGALAFTDGNDMTAREFADMLDSSIPSGRVVVLLGSCGSGAMLRENTVEGRMETDNWNRCFTEAFADLNSTPHARYNELVETGDVSNKEYYVLTAAEKHESSTGIEQSKKTSQAYNFFATMVGASVGFERNGIYQGVKWYYYYGYWYPVFTKLKSGSTTDGKWTKKKPGDANGDNSISFLECAEYVGEQQYTGLGLAIDDSSVWYSSDGSDPVLFRR